jgi:hypothetical protein
LGEGHGDSVASTKLKSIHPDALRNLYIDETFLPSLDLDHIGEVLE